MEIIGFTVSMAAFLLLVFVIAPTMIPSEGTALATGAVSGFTVAAAITLIVLAAKALT
jgi:hypothetical protein